MNILCHALFTFRSQICTFLCELNSLSEKAISFIIFERNYLTRNIRFSKCFENFVLVLSDFDRSSLKVTVNECEKKMFL